MSGVLNLRPLHFGLLRQRIAFTAVLEHLAWRPQATQGPQWRGPCPLHEPAHATSRCFAVQTEKNLYCCHQCGSEGNVLDLWAAVRRLPILEAAWDLVDTFELQPPLLQEGPSGSEAKPQPPDGHLTGTRKSSKPQSAKPTS